MIILIIILLLLFYYCPSEQTVGIACSGAHGANPVDRQRLQPSLSFLLPLYYYYYYYYYSFNTLTILRTLSLPLLFIYCIFASHNPLSPSDVIIRYPRSDRGRFS